MNERKRALDYLHDAVKKWKGIQSMESYCARLEDGTKVSLSWLCDTLGEKEDTDMGRLYDGYWKLLKKL